MSYRSYNRLPYIDSYEQALEHTNVTPIKGSKPLSYPLGERRYHRSFGIRVIGDEASKPIDNARYKPAPTAKDGDVELLLYGAPVITFHKPEQADAPQRLTLSCTYYHWNASDCHFIVSVLGRYVASANTNKSRLVLTLRNGSKIVIPRKQNLTLDIRKGPIGSSLAPSNPEQAEHTVIRLNRGRANAVRAKYGEFFRYVKGMISVRKYPLDTLSWRGVAVAQVIKVSSEEILGVVPTVPPSTSFPLPPSFPLTSYSPQYPPLRNAPHLTNVRFVDKYVRMGVDRKPPKETAHHMYDERTGRSSVKYVSEPYEMWLANTKEFLELCSTPADDPDQYEKFRQAFVWLAFYSIPNPRAGRDVVVETRVLPERLNEIIFKYHSEEVFERVPAKPGSVPSSKYEKLVTRVRD